ncbi:type 1 glutamine amidotransferase domain-containing protein [Bdellovibrio reynosensis]|uniref:Type 1 glutamine amidotransferase n=1 Tax=Bdellovibrio reynosensis TaxID=2835041 RepID=A0ABY4CA37_9BACT|nr:type 1 glutamine amidotransferase domain-containing protein [Bdellovibrio reynosensis]UOF01790.1 type 1 glutamine amidotransferase [Bdellovibrio reynosensis]
MADLSGKSIAILAAEGFEESELFDPKKALERAGADTHIISLKKGVIKAWNHDKWGKTIEVDRTVEDADSAEYDGLLIPGGVMSPDKLRLDDEAVQFVQEFIDDEKPIAAICHGPQILIETSILVGRKVTSYPSVRTDIMNAGADWVDEEVVEDSGLVTSRKPADIPAFNKKMIEVFAQTEDQRKNEIRRHNRDESQPSV